MKVEFTLKLADYNIAVKSLYPFVKKMCCDYLTDDAADFSINICSSDIDFEREKSAREDKMEGRAVRNFSDEYLETLAVYRKIAEKMIDYDTLLFHGSVVSVDGVGYLFTAKSGTGKSTHTRLWRELFDKRAVMVNDDKPLLKITDDGVIVYGTPWDGKHRLSSNIAVPLKAICILERGETNHIEMISKREAYVMMMQQSYRPHNSMKMVKMMNLVDKLGECVELYKLSCNMDIEAAKVAYQGMNERKKM